MLQRACHSRNQGGYDAAQRVHTPSWPPPCAPTLRPRRYVDQMPLTDVEQRCPASVYPGLDPYPLPDFVPHNQTAVDIHPGELSRRGGGGKACGSAGGQLGQAQAQAAAAETACPEPSSLARCRPSPGMGG